MERGEEMYFENYCTNKERLYCALWCGRTAEMHKHVDFYELFYVMSGEVVHYHKGKMQKLEKGCMYLFALGESHALIADEFMSIHFSFLMKPEYVEPLIDKKPELSEMIKKAGYLFGSLEEKELGYFFMLSNLMPNREYGENVASLLLQKAIDILEMCNITREKCEEYVQDIVQKIKDHTYLTCSVEKISQNYPIARSLLSRGFRNLRGMTISQYQKKEKMKLGAYLLRNSDISITEIAGALGYDSLSHFLTSFKNMYGTTPKKYRSLHKKEDITSL